MKKLEYAPIVIIAYKRPENLKALLLSLEKNKELHNSKIYFFIDKFKNLEEEIPNKEVIRIANIFSKKYNVEIIKNSRNLGLKSNILNSIKYIFSKYEKAIFLEDDLIVGESFLNFMNTSLNLYKDNKKVKHISGYNYPLKIKKYNSSFFTRYMSCWGWATWKDRWEENSNYSKNLISKKNKFYRIRFTVFGFEKDFESQLINNENGLIQTWAIFWLQHIFIAKGLCLNPSVSLVNNIGNSGEHGVDGSLYNMKLNNTKITHYPKTYFINYFNLFKLILFFKKKTEYKNKLT